MDDNICCNAVCVWQGRETREKIKEKVLSINEEQEIHQPSPEPMVEGLREKNIQQLEVL